MPVRGETPPMLVEKLTPETAVGGLAAQSGRLSEKSLLTPKLVGDVIREGGDEGEQMAVVKTFLTSVSSFCSSS